MINRLSEAMVRKLQAKGRGKLAEMYRRCFASTWETTLQRENDGTVFLVTGDIPAMWLRDSACQVSHYLPFAAEEKEVRRVILALLRRQFACIKLDPYANAFNAAADNSSIHHDRSSWTEAQRPWIWERKYEVDSLCHPLHLAYRFYQKTGDISWADEHFLAALHCVLDVFETEQHHGEKSPYFFERDNCPDSDTLPNGGRGTPVAYTGMTWSGFRPSDDACRYGYLIPANLFAARVMKEMAEILTLMKADAVLIERVRKLHDEIEAGVRTHGIVHHPVYGEVYAYETDGLGHHLLMDDANVPSLLSMPYLDCVAADDPVYCNTRRLILSGENPYYYEGKACRGIGSPHTPARYVWPIALCMQGLTSNDPEEIRMLVDMLEGMDAGTFLMHEGVDADDPAQFSRPWFAWANAMFSELMQKAIRSI